MMLTHWSRFGLPLVFALGLALVPPAAPKSSLTSEVLASYEPEPGAAPAEAARAFLDALDAPRRTEALHPLASDERGNWTNLPPGATEGGVRLGDLDEAQLERACDLLATVLSPQGYAQTRDILLADDRLLRNGEPRVGFGAENFWLVVFGTPSATEPWALQLDGHHLAWNLSFEGDAVEMSPSFIGTQPARYTRGDTEVVPMRGEVEAAFALVGLLDEEQRGAAVLAPERKQLVAGPGQDGNVPPPAGVAVKTFTPRQRAALLELLGHYVGDLPAPQAAQRMAALEGELDAMHFAWCGPTKGPADVSYRVQGPSLIVEYACQGLGGNPLDHLHAIYRDPTNEYGRGE